MDGIERGVYPDFVQDVEHTSHRKAERRSSQRFQTVYRLVRIARSDDEGLARCRNISNTGVRLDTTMRLVAGDAIAIWFSPGIEVHGIVVRRDERTCGVRFEEIQNSRYLLRNSAKEGLESRARPPRFSTDLAAAFYFDGLKKFGRVVNISQWGMNVAHVQGLQRGVHVQVALANDRARRAVVRWTSSENAGLYLLDPFSVEELGSTEKLKTIW